tara:strand:+ start:109 stop:1287 length:1179 start_codon:yes stop_codon:yes gene_type:complete
MSIDNNLYEKSIKILTDLIGFKTISGQDNNDLINYCENILSEIGIDTFKVYDDEKKRVNLFGTLKGKNESGKKPIILSGHTDVVPISNGWSSDPFVATIKNDKLYGRGSCDMKGFIACTLAYASVFKDSNLNRDLHFCYTFDEETACIGAPLLIKELKKRNIKNGICIIGEPTKMKIIDAHKGMNEYTIHFGGLAGHSSKPHLGVNAAEYATRYVGKLLEIREELKKRVKENSIFDPPHSTLSVGGIKGGIAHNVIVDKCTVEWETRPVVKEDGEFVTSEIDKFSNEILLPEMKKVFPNSFIKKEIVGEVVGFNRLDESEACEFVSSITGDNSREVVSFGTEAGLFQELGISTVVCGPGSIEQAHKIDEFIELSEIKKCLNFLEGLKNKSVN